MSDPWAEFRVAPAQPAEDPWAEFRAQTPAEPSTMDTLRDVGANLAGAAGRGVAGFVGLPGDLEAGSRWLVGKGYEAITGNRAPPPPAPPEGMPDLRPPTSADVRGAVGAVGVPVERRAESAEGRVVQDAVEGALSMPVSLPSVLYGAISGGGSGIAGEIAKYFGAGPAVETAARVVGGITAPVAAGRVSSAIQARQQRPPTTEALRAQSQASYDAARKAGVAVQANRFGDAVDDIARIAKVEGIDPVLHPRATRALARLEEAKAAGADLTLDEIETLRRVIGTAGKSLEADERRIAGILRDGLDDFVNNLTPIDVTRGNAPEAVRALNEARGLWGRARRGEIIEELIDRAENRAAQFSGSGFENALRTEFRNLAQNPKRLRGFSAEEQAAIRRVARGGPVENMLRLVGKFAPTSLHNIVLGSGAGFALGGPAGAGAVAATGAAARGGATALTARNARLAAEIARAGGALPRPPDPRQALATALLASRREAERGVALPQLQDLLGIRP